MNPPNAQCSSLGRFAHDHQTMNAENQRKSTIGLELIRLHMCYVRPNENSKNALQKKLFKIEIKNYVCTCDTSRSNRWQSASAAIRTRTIHCSIEKTKLHNVCTRCTSTGAEIGGFEHEKTSALCWRVNCSGKPPRAAPFRTEDYGSDTQLQKTITTCYYYI